MRPSRLRLLCRSRNPFSPSIVLWQHFVLPSQILLHQQRLSSSAAESAHVSPADHVKFSTAANSDAPSQLHAEIDEHGETKPTVRRLKGKPFVRKPAYPERKDNRREGRSIYSTMSRTRYVMTEARKAVWEGSDYKGIAISPKHVKNVVEESELPWCVPIKGHETSAMLRLTYEIANFHNYAKPNEYETLARKHVIEQLRQRVHKVLPDYDIEVFGSERTGLALAVSDIDIRLMKGKASEDSENIPSPKERDELQKALHLFFKTELLRNASYEAPKTTHARYPLVTYRDRDSGLDVQIVLCNDTSCQRAAIYKYLREYPNLGQLYSVIKTTLDVRGLSDVFYGGFGAYPILMMVVASLQQRPHPSHSLSGAFRNFFEFWGQFDTTKYGISLEPAELFDKSQVTVMTDTTAQKIKKGHTIPKPLYMLTLRDPAEESNDLGRQATAIRHLQATFKRISNRLWHELGANTRPSLLGDLVGPAYTLQQLSRQKLEAYGRAIEKDGESSTSVKAEEAKNVDQTGLPRVLRSRDM